MRPGAKWRFQTEYQALSSCHPQKSEIFDEVVVDDWLHVEQMDLRRWWVSLGNGDDRRVFWITINREGKAKVMEGDP